GGKEPTPFTGEAIKCISKWSNRIPRLINSICDNALLLAFAEESQQVLESHVREAAEDLDVVARTVAPLPLPPEPKPVEMATPVASPIPAIAPFRLLESSNGLHTGAGSKPWWNRWAHL